MSEPMEENTYPMKQSAAFAGSTLVTMGLVDLLAHLGPTGLLVGGLASYVAWKHGPELYEYVREKLPSSHPSFEQAEPAEHKQPPKHSRGMMDRALGRFPDAVGEEAADEDEETENEDWEREEEAFYAPLLSPAPRKSTSRSAPGATWQQTTTIRGATWQEPPEDGNTDLLDLAPNLKVHPDSLFSGRVLVAGLPGSGKSNTMRRIIEECGRLGLPFLLIDTDGEYASLLPYLQSGVVIGASNRMGVPAPSFAEVNREQAFLFGQHLLAENWQAIFDVKSYTEREGRPDENMAALVFMDIIYGMRQWQEARPPRERIPSMIFLEEAQVWLPQQPSSSTLNRSTLRDLQALFFRSARDGRRRGIGLVIIAHRIAGIHKEVLACDWMILHQPQATDLKRYLDLVPSVPRERFQRLVRGRAIIISPAGTLEVSVHRARSKDNGVTPGLSALHRYQERAATHLPVSPASRQEAGATVRLPETWPEQETRYPSMERPAPAEEITRVTRPAPMLSDLTDERARGREEERRASTSAAAVPSKASRQPTELEQAVELWKSGKVHSIRGIERELGVSYHRASALFKEMKTRRLID